MKHRSAHASMLKNSVRFFAIVLAAFLTGLYAANRFGFFGLGSGNSNFLMTSSDTRLNGFSQTSVVHTHSTYRVNFRGRNHRLSTVALSESHDKSSLTQSHCRALAEIRSKPQVETSVHTIPFQLSAGRGVVFNHQTLLANGAQTGWMQLLFENHGTCVEISAKGLSAGELLPQDLILMVASLEREPQT